MLAQSSPSKILSHDPTFPSLHSADNSTFHVQCKTFWGHSKVGAINSCTSTNKRQGKAQTFCKVKEILIQAALQNVLHLYFAGVGVSCSCGAAPSVVNAHNFPTFPTCRQALGAASPQRSASAESQRWALRSGVFAKTTQFKSAATGSLKQTGLAICSNQVQICVGRENGWRGGRHGGRVILVHPQVSECRVVLGGPSGLPVHALPSS